MGKKSTKWYEDTLKRMIERRTGKEFDVFLTPQVATAAACWQILDHIHSKLVDDKLTSIETGCQGQQKTIINPLLPIYNNLHRTFIMHLEALGLNYRSNTQRIKDPVSEEGKKSRMEEYFDQVM